MKKNWGFVKLGHFPVYCLVSYNMPHKELMSVLNRRKYVNWSKAISEDKNIFDSDDRNFAVRRVLQDTKKEIHPPYLFILLKDNVKLDTNGYVTIAHEAFHIVQFVSEYVSACLIEEKESSAYLHSHLMESAVSVVKEALNKKL